mmetsp:Transcript_44796/g.101421  ORF Transcript_44796/g.101421 Transcript_44796/m.101421 type:complete len:514 (-) Transcript_44796:114-1655(-)
MMKRRRLGVADFQRLNFLREAISSAFVVAEDDDDDMEEDGSMLARLQKSAHDSKIRAVKAVRIIESEDVMKSVCRLFAEVGEPSSKRKTRLDDGLEGEAPFNRVDGLEEVWIPMLDEGSEQYVEKVAAKFGQAPSWVDKAVQDVGNKSSEYRAQAGFVSWDAPMEETVGEDEAEAEKPEEKAPEPKQFTLFNKLNLVAVAEAKRAAAIAEHEEATTIAQKADALIAHAEAALQQVKDEFQRVDTARQRAAQANITADRATNLEMGSEILAMASTQQTDAAESTMRAVVQAQIVGQAFSDITVALNTARESRKAKPKLWKQAVRTAEVTYGKIKYLGDVAKAKLARVQRAGAEAEQSSQLAMMKLQGKIAGWKEEREQQLKAEAEAARKKAEQEKRLAKERAEQARRHREEEERKAEQARIIAEQERFQARIQADRERQQRLMREQHLGAWRPGAADPSVQQWDADAWRTARATQPPPPPPPEQPPQQGSHPLPPQYPPHPDQGWGHWQQRRQW